MGIASVLGLGNAGLPEFGQWKVVSSREMTGTSGANAIFDISDLKTAGKNCYIVAITWSVSGTYRFLCFVGASVSPSGTTMGIGRVPGTRFRFDPSGNTNSDAASSLLLVDGNKIYAPVGQASVAPTDIHGTLYVIEFEE